MNKSESKYRNTAIRIDEAFLDLLGKKDIDFITVKEICAASGINRSTFYLHYETINDLLMETAEYVNSRFYSYFSHLNMDYDTICTAQKDALIFITPEFLTPWLSFVRENSTVYSMILKRFDTLPISNGLSEAIQKAVNTVLERYGIPEKDRKYMMQFYLEGLNAIVKQWIKGGCTDSIEELVRIIEGCVRAR